MIEIGEDLDKVGNISPILFFSIGKGLGFIVVLEKGNGDFADFDHLQQWQPS